ncbi:MAG TPA: hypothetical protein PLR12_08645, partial [Clostridia bacterium]|nr:hypothetical protein [Clostridia bacterium]
MFHTAKPSLGIKLLSLTLMAALLAFGLISASAESAFPPVDVTELKVGMVLIGSQDDGFSGAHYKGLEGMKEALGLKDEQVLYKFNVPENAECDAALRELVDAGCQIIFGN